MENNIINIEKLIESYENAGIHIYTENGKLKFKAPVGTMTDERKKILKKYKEMIITYLNYEDETVLLSDEENRYSIFPLTNIQSAYLAGRGKNYLYGGVSCHAYGELVIPKANHERMTEAWHRVILRHDMLRAVIYQEGYQQVLKDVELPEICSVYCNTEEEFSKKTMEVRNELMYKQYETGKFPMYEIKLTSFGEKTMLHFSIDMLIADFPSVNIILSDFMSFYNNPEYEPEELDITFRDILLFRQSKKNSRKGKEIYNRDKKYWLDKVNDFPSAPQLPVMGQPTGVDIKQFGKMLDKKQCEKLFRLAGKHHITPSALILSAYGEVISRWSESSRFALNITKMDRQQIHSQSNKVVGDFTDVIVLEADYSQNVPFI